MDKALIKCAAACLAGTATEAREKQAQGVWEAAQADPTKYTLMGAGLGALAGGAGGGLLSWLRSNERDNRRRRSRVGRDALAGALVGGGLGAGAGVLPSLLKKVQEGTKPPKIDVKPRSGLPGAISKDIKNLINPKTIGAAGAGGAAGGLGLMAYLRHLSMKDIAKMSPEQAVTTLEQMGWYNVPADSAKRVLSDTVRQGGAGRSMVGQARTWADRLKGLVTGKPPMNLGLVAGKGGKIHLPKKLPRGSLGSFWRGNRAAFRSLARPGGSPVGSKAAILAMLLGAGITGYGAAKM